MERNAKIRRRSKRRRMSRPAKLTLAFLAASGAVGLAATVYGIAQASPFVGIPGPAVVLAGQLVGICTLANLLLRFVRWQYLLRRLDVRLPTVPSLGAFVGSFAFLPVPLYMGQLVARTRLVDGIAARGRVYLLLAFVWERALDVWALAILAAPAFPRPWNIMLVVAGALAFVPGIRVFAFHLACRATSYASQFVTDEAFEVGEEAAARAVSGQVFAVSALMSLGAWLITALSVLPLGWAVGASLGPIVGAAVAAKSILVGALSLVPLGAGVSGMLMLRWLEALLGDASRAAQVVMVYRAATVWLTVGIGGVAALFHRQRSIRRVEHDHFDEIDADYDAWLPPHFRGHLVTKKVSAMVERLGALEPGMRGLDIGCGRGWYLREVARAGVQMVGIDLSGRQLAAARGYVGNGVSLLRGSVLGLPFRARSFDFAYIINVLHHMATPAEQVQALREIAASIRPGGMIFVHEMNVINPLFRFYLGYIFPIVKGIEEGVEPYMDPSKLTEVPGLELAAIDFFTFIPDFTPALLMPALVRLERKLEKSPLSRYSAHFMAVFKRAEGED